MSLETPSLSRQMNTLAQVLGGGRPRLMRSEVSSGLKLVTLHLARCEDYPEGNSRCGYQVLAPLDVAGRLSVERYERTRSGCLVRRYRVSEEDRMGRLVHRAGGRQGATWRLEFVGAPTMSETGYHWDDHLFKTGEYVSVQDIDGRLKTYKVAQILKLGHKAPGTPNAFHSGTHAVPQDTRAAS